jgi:hypothetical protein
MANYNQTFLDILQATTNNPQKRKGGSTFIARVTHVVTGPTYAGTNVPDPSYNDPTDLGKIQFQLLFGNQDRTSVSNANTLAKPMSSAIKRLPVEGEFVKITVGPGLGLNETRDQVDLYYGEPFNLWGSNHHNALPDLGDYNLFVHKNTSDYQQSQASNRPNNAVSGAAPFPLGPYFREQDDVRVLKQFVGDVTLEGRWGNSIRFGSTTAGGTQDNYWSATGSVGNPITIIRNGQGAQLDKTPWVPTVENINRDASLIYLTKGQQIVIDDIQNNFPLTSWQVTLESNNTTSIPLQQQLTSYDMISPKTQDEKVINSTNNTGNV